MNGKRVFLFAFCLAASVSALAQPQRAFVSAANGSDSSPCSRSLPCRNFAAAAAALSSGGEIIALDSGGYGTFSITRPLSVIAPSGVYAGVTAVTGNGITVNAGAADRVLVRGISVTGLGAMQGLQAQSGDLLIDGCSFTNFADNGIDIENGGNVTIRKTSTDRNANFGMRIHGGASMAITRAMIVDSSASSNSAGGILASDNTRVTVRNSTTAQNGGGMDASGADAKIWVSGCTISNNNGEGIGTGGTSEAYVASSTIAGNGIGLLQVAGTIFTMGNNTVRANTTDANTAITVIPPM